MGDKNYLPDEVTMKTINGQTEQEYLLGAIEVLRRELSTSHNKLEVMERIDSLKDCLIATLTDGSK